MERFRPPLKKNLVHLGNHIYVNPEDPLYYEKLLRYARGGSAEAHYRLGQKYEREKDWTRALRHYREACSAPDSSYALQARQAVRRLSGAAVTVPAAEAGQPAGRRRRSVPLAIAVGLVLGLLALNAFLLLLLYMDKAKSAAPAPRQEAASTEVACGAVAASSRIDLTVSASPNGMGDAPSLGAASPAERASVNLVRTALASYIRDKGGPPPTIQALAGAYPDNYLSGIPAEPESGSRAEAPALDGAGGWVYRPSAALVEDMVYPNVRGMPNIPYEPVRIVISKRDHELRLVTGSLLLAEEPVGLGRDGATPEGRFAVADRVRNPRGSRPGVYGVAGLGMGKIAVHGTNDDSSIGADRSMGCIRLANPDMAKLFPLVPKGAEVRVAADSFGNGAPAGESPPAALSFPGESPASREEASSAFHWMG